MAAGSLLALLDDIATVLDDVAVMTKVATKKTAGVLGDDLALNAQQVQGIRAERELPVVWAVAKGSLVNKAILVPAALLISAFAPWAVTPLMMVGGAYLCYEGVEKLAHRFLHSRQEHEQEHAARVQAVQDETVDMVAFEKEKVKGAVRTDFILSAEIIVISLGTVTGHPFLTQLAVLSAIALVMTVGVYGLVGGIVKLDDMGLALVRRDGPVSRTIGRALVSAAPLLMKFLAIAGTLAMFLVGGHILVQGVPALHHMSESIAAGPAGWLLSKLFDAGVGIAAGTVVLLAVQAFSKLRGRKAG